MYMIDILFDKQSELTQPASYRGPLSAHQRNAIQIAFLWQTGSGPISLAYWQIWQRWSRDTEQKLTSGHFSISLFWLTTKYNDIKMSFAQIFVFQWTKKFKRCFERILYHFTILGEKM